MSLSVTVPFASSSCATIRAKRAAVVGFFHLRFQALIAGMLHYIETLRAQGLRVFHHLQVRPFALVHCIDIRRSVHFQRAVFAHQKQQPFDAHRKADGRRRFAAKFLNQTIVTAAAAHSCLRAEFVGRPLKTV